MSDTWERMKKESKEELEMREKIIQLFIESKFTYKRAVKVLSFAQHQLEDAALTQEINLPIHSVDDEQSNLPGFQ